MLSDLGGICGFYLGLSVIALFEFLELFVDVLMLGCTKLCDKNNKTAGAASNAGKNNKQEKVPFKKSQEIMNRSLTTIDIN